MDEEERKSETEHANGVQDKQTQRENDNLPASTKDLSFLWAQASRCHTLVCNTMITTETQAFM